MLLNKYNDKKSNYKLKLFNLFNSDNTNPNFFNPISLILLF